MKSFLSFAKSKHARPLFISVGMVLFLLLLAVSFSSCAFASDRGQSRGISPDQMIKDLRVKLALSPETEGDIRPIIYDSFKQREALVQEARNSGRGSRSGMRDKMQAHQQETKNQLAEFLTPEQLTRYQEYISEQHKTIRGSRQGGGGRRFSGF